MTTTLPRVDAQDFKDWMDANEYSVRGLAAALKREPRTIQRYRDGSLKVPRVVDLALVGLAHIGKPTPKPERKNVREPERGSFEEAP